MQYGSSVIAWFLEESVDRDGPAILNELAIRKGAFKAYASNDFPTPATRALAKTLMTQVNDRTCTKTPKT